MNRPKPIPTRPPDPDRQEGGERLVRPAESVASVMPPPDSLAGSGKLIAPKGRFRVVLVDTFEGPFADVLLGDFSNQQDAKKVALAHAGNMTPCYVYDDCGKLIFSAGKP